MAPSKLAADRPMIVLVVSPLNALMQDKVISLCEKDVAACFSSIDAASVTSCEDVLENE
ncbi:hypothetical protein DPMN_062374 [Dreissena polymorpha]|uniref:Uncharacterized protein n=1 Tax=Dreissena polymorpha TaxID=45954 RepID=A0A9D4HI35_DREPO|nr:hypothetical protein DPMN_062374 [Dreissena polymorpha]